MGTSWGFLNHRFSSPVPTTGTTSVPSASPSSFKGAAAPGGWWGSPGHRRALAAVLLWPLISPAPSPPLSPAPPLGAAGQPTSYSRAPAEVLPPRHTNYYTGTARGCLGFPKSPSFTLTQGLGTTGCRLEERKGDVVTLAAAWGGARLRTSSLLHHQTCQSEQPYRAPVFLQRRRSFYRSRTRTPLPTNPTEKNPQTKR